MKKIVLILIAMLVAMSFVACGNSDDEVKPTEVPTEEPTEAPTEVPTEEPTECPTEEPTAAPTEAPTPEPLFSDLDVGSIVDGVYVNETFDIRFVIPEDWTSMDAFAINTVEPDGDTVTIFAAESSAGSSIQVQLVEIGNTIMDDTLLAETTAQTLALTMGGEESGVVIGEVTTGEILDTSYSVIPMDMNLGVLTLDMDIYMRICDGYAVQIYLSASSLDTITIEDLIACFVAAE